MADAIISIVAERVAAIIEDQIRYEVNLLSGVEKKVLELSGKLETVRNVLDDAEKRGVNNQSVKSWLKKLENTAYEMDDILDAWNYTLLKHRMEASAEQKVFCSFIPSSCLCFNKVAVRRDTAKKIQNVKATIDQILKEKDDFSFVMSLPATADPVPMSWRVQSSSSIELDKIYGRDQDRDNLVRKVMLNGGDIQIVCVVGMGGLGKTTLAQLVYNDTLVKECFGSRIWIYVSDPFDVAGIARGIVDSVGVETIPPNANQLDLVLEKLKKSVLGKKFLLVLDDVWTEDYNKWKPLEINLKYGAPGSKILVTTRNEGVAKMMGTLDYDIYRLQQLSDEECWLLLRRKFLSGKSEEECGEFEDVGKKIASKCEGLPLAANFLGSLLQFKNSFEEWENVLESEIWKLEKAEVDLFPHLLLSYNELSPPLKRCFSYCVTYPKDFRMNASYLIQEWMAQGYLGYDIGNAGAKLKGQDYFNTLAMRAFFQEFEKGRWSEEIEWCKMHDVVHDFAQFLRKYNDRVEAAEMIKRTCQVCHPFSVSQAQEYRSRSFYGRESPTELCDCLTNLRVLRFEEQPYGLPQGMEKLIHLRWLLLSGTKLSNEDLKIICRLYFLQTLVSADCSIEEIPGEIGNLVHLRHLDLSRNRLLKELPESICSLLKLQFLNIERCYDLYGLPEGIHMLQKLQHFLTEGTPVSRRFPQGVGELIGLRTLRAFHGGSGSNKLRMLKGLNCLSGFLTLEIQCSSMSDLEDLVEDAREAELRNKIHIRELHMEFINDEERSSISSLWVDVIEALEPNQNLNELTISGYKGSRLPHWMSSPLNLIKQIELYSYSHLSSLPAMGKLPLLEDLNLRFMYELKLVGRELLGIEASSSNHVVAFPKLKQLTFHNCSKWCEWEDITAEEEESSAISVMPRLTHLEVLGCEGLKKLPHRLLRKASSLQVVKIRYSPELAKCYGDKDGSPWRSISQYNPHLQHDITSF